MNTEQIKGKLQVMKGEIKKTWGKLTDDEIMMFEGQQDKFYGTLKEKYGLAREVAEKQIKKFEELSAANWDKSKNPDTTKVA